MLFKGVLGPILFSIYINDLINSAPMFNYILFADDTNIFSKDPQLLKENLKHIEEWCLANKSVLNYTKTFQVIFKSPNKKKIASLDNYELELGNQKLEIKQCTKFLWIQLDSKIIFKEFQAQTVFICSNKVL